MSPWTPPLTSLCNISCASSAFSYCWYEFKYDLDYVPFLFCNMLFDTCASFFPGGYLYCFAFFIHIFLDTNKLASWVRKSMSSFFFTVVHLSLWIFQDVMLFSWFSAGLTMSCTILLLCYPYKSTTPENRNSERIRVFYSPPSHQFLSGKEGPTSILQILFSDGRASNPPD